MVEVIFLLILVAFLLYYALWKPQRFWIERKVKQGPPIPLFGDRLKIFFRKESGSELVSRLYNRHPNERYEGMYQMNHPILILRDPDLIKQITVKDFDHFTDHRKLLPDETDPLWNKNLFALKGDPWREMRTMLSPAFTSSKMRSMFCLINESAEQFVNFYLAKKEKETIVEMKDSFTRYANDVIATCAFGIQVDSLKERNNEFYLMGKETADFSEFRRNLTITLNLLVPKIANLFKLPIFTDKICNFFTNIVTDTLRIREENNIVRPDMLNLLMEARKGRLKHDDEFQEKDAGFATVEESHIGKGKKHHKKEISDIDIAAQALAFFFAGFETVSTLMCFVAYELALNPDIQEKLILEVNDTQEICNGKLTYEILAKMKYMDMVISETLRKWPSAVVIDRACIKPYTIQPKSPNESPVHLKPGNTIWLPIFGLHRDETYYPNPEKFDPERFSDENKHSINSYAYIPFGSGPRNCIGSRFALMETKTVFFHILSKFRITVVEKTAIPIVILKKQLNLASEKGFWLGLKPINLNNS